MMNFSFGGKKHRGHSNDRKRAAKAGKPRLARRGLQLESLEERSMLAFNPLVISEINYNPPANYNGGDKDKYEFIELYNAGFAPLQLAGVRVSASEGLNNNYIDVTISGNRLLQPGEYAVVVFDSAAMQERYGTDVASKIVGTFTLLAQGSNGLPSNTATIRLRTPVGINENTDISFKYDDGDNGLAIFPSGADGEGPTLELVEPASNLIGTDYANGNNWNSSEEYGGSPGRAPAVEVGQRVVINEILSNSNDATGEVDKIEIVNISKDPVNLGGWMITDNEDAPVGSVDYLQGYVIPNNTILQPGQYMVFTEAQFNVPGPNAFAISSGGGTLYLISREDNGVRFMEDTIDYDATRQSQSIGRAPNLTGDFLPLSTQTFGAANSEHVLSPIVISEVMYKRATPNTALNYIELTNRTNAAVNMSGWEVGGVSTVLGAVTIPANKSAVLVSFNPTTGTAAATFRSTYGIDATVQLIGPWNSESNLSSNGERLTLMQPHQDGVVTTKVLADSVDFNDDSPWPEGPSGGISGVNYSLNRTSLTNVGDEPHNWRGALPTPGSYTAPTTTSLLDGLVISEIMYNPTAVTFSGGNPVQSNHLEFVEIYNPTNATLNLSNAGLAQGVDFRFLSGVTIAPGERIVITPFNPAVPSLLRDEFSSAYGIQFPGSVRTFGPWTQPGSLSNGGEGLALVDNLGNTIFEFEYNNRGGWPERADAGGSSLELINPDAVPIGVANTAPYLNDPTKWRASSEYRGTPGFASSTAAPSIVINEIQSHTDFQYSDAIELYNASATAVDLSGWFLTDNPAKQFSEWFEIPAMVLQPGEYVTFDACPDPEFPCPSGVPHLPFSLDAAEGEEVYLLSPSNAQGDAYFADHVSIQASFNNVTYGRWPNGSGLMFPMSARTLSQYNSDTDPTLPVAIPTPGNIYTNGANSGPVNSHVVISEIMYNPNGANPLEFEYIELQNTLGVAALLGPIESGAGWEEFDPVGWRLKGIVDFEFKQQHQIPALGTMLLVSFDPVAFPDKLAAFRSRYSVAASVPIVGPFESYRTISDDGGELTLDRPDEGPGVLPVEERFTPNVLADRVIFDDVAPWPTSADGGGQSLTRTGPTAYGNAVESWTAAAPTPGSVSSTPTGAPKVTAVTLNGSTWAPAFVTAVSAGNPTPGFTVAKGTQQSAVIPWEKINQVSITFDKAVTIASGALAIRGLNTPNYTVAATPTNPSGSTYTWTITTPIVGDRLLIELDDTKVTSSGSSLDGEWTDNTSTGNSGNGTAGGDFKFRVNVLPGDVDGDGDTQNDDRMDVRLAMFTSTSVGGSTYSTRRDLDGSGKINVVDFIIARNHLNKTLPVGTPNSPAAPDSVVVRADRSDRRATATTTRAVTRAAVDQALSTDILSGSDATGSDAAESSTMLRARRAGRAVLR